MTLGRFMEQALAHPEYGYYVTRDPLGRDGDFTTAPEISQVFGELIGAWAMDMWTQMGRPERFDLVECGPGRGTLMADMMRVGKLLPGFKEAARIYFIETSPVLREKQKAAMEGHEVRWCDDLRALGGDAPKIIIANEFLDALPVEQLKRGEDGWQQCYVACGPDGFAFEWGAPEEGITEYLPDKTESQQVYEVSPARLGFLGGCAQSLVSGGAALFIDYGYTVSHHGDTVQAVRAHKFGDVLKQVGESDVTAHVDFAALEHEGLHKTPVVTQGTFLRNLGIEQRMTALKAAAPDSTIEDDVNRLIARDQMGELFKVVCFYKDEKLQPAGFS